MQSLEAAMHENLLRASMRVGALTAAAAGERVGPWHLIDSGTGLDRFNHGMVAASPADPESALALVRDWFAQRSTAFHIDLRGDADADLIAAALASGFEEFGREPAMSLSPLPALEPLPEGFAVRQAVTDGDVLRYGTVDARAWHEITLGISRTAASFPDFTLWLGEMDGVPVATAMAVHTGDVVGIYNVQVREEARGRGLGRAMTLAAIEAGRARGATVASLQSSELGLPVYRRLGFETRYWYLALAPKS
jgi:GNAT superfamily N-acetyltransferase